ncbi:MAG: hypothetical protein ISN64_01495 [Rickettsia sp.]|nr:hypothetical protein [Rickettsia sp.]
MTKIFAKEYENIESYIEIIDPNQIKISKNFSSKKILLTISIILSILFILFSVFFYVKHSKIYNQKYPVRIENVNFLTENGKKIIKYHMINFSQHEISFRDLKIRFFGIDNKLLGEKFLKKNFFLTPGEDIEFQEEINEVFLNQIKDIDILIIDDISIS